MRHRLKDNPVNLTEYVTDFCRCVCDSYLLRTMYATIQVEKDDCSPLWAPIFEHKRASPEQGRINSVV
jgi:hypothetical protein